MGVTAIKRIRNESQCRFGISSTEGWEAGAYTYFGPRSSRSVDIWIPWATTEDEWENHRLRALAYGKRADGTTVLLRSYAIWQGVQVDRVDRVRCTYAEATRAADGSVRYAASDTAPYANPGAFIPGVSRVNGDRVLYVHPDLSIELTTNL
jgi:hypothetical protein